MQVGKGEMPDDEIDILKSVNNICKQSKIGMIFNCFFDNILNKPISETEIIQLGKRFY